MIKTVQECKLGSDKKIIRVDQLIKFGEKITKKISNENFSIFDKDKTHEITIKNALLDSGSTIDCISKGLVKNV